MIKEIGHRDIENISKIADWYWQEFSIPVEKTTRRLSNLQPGDLIYQLGFFSDARLLTTGGLSHHVGLLNDHAQFKNKGSWVTLLCTDPEHRGKGYGKELMMAIEKKAKTKSFQQLFLHTYTAESFYLKQGWQPIDMVGYKGHQTSVLTKTLQ